ncbi:hypothetical protein GCM10010497_45870 [Streptomyces cinereoruber]|uniref:Uncharacterized protein n=1 Tax=Streptomyces cinereoruber TaxID=67260 RepID=A0AAV4KSJ1_9ACTN|nr:hypothetical protein [Streptomyces cinereoruber]MBB4160056.1 hypothetical protein [Streptomyces cinereoruber]NIH60994.1 hypothetical protein [Streptomyces cinereoruber]GGR37826.1 hypothetical protein GCM10010497_45870 [Streptomyces cinereoruber]
MERTHAPRTEPSPPPTRRVIATGWVRRAPSTVTHEEARRG